MEYKETECKECKTKGSPLFLRSPPRDKKDYYCSEGCRYNEETGFSGEEY